MNPKGGNAIGLTGSHSQSVSTEQRCQHVSEVSNLPTVATEQPVIGNGTGSGHTVANRVTVEPALVSFRNFYRVLPLI